MNLVINSLLGLTAGFFFAAAIHTLPQAHAVESDKAAKTKVATSDPGAAIASSIKERIKDFPPIDAVRKTPVEGIYEVQYAGTEILYTNKDGSYFLQGTLIETKTRKNVTAERIAALTAIDYSTLPKNDSFPVKLGDGSRQMSVFVDPNCGYCKRYEADLKDLDNTTIHVYLFPILGQNSVDKAKAVWCSKDRAKAWHDWMLNGVEPTPATASCDTSAIDRNLAFGRDKKINGTPTSFFVNGKRAPGAIPKATVQDMLAAK